MTAAQFGFRVEQESLSVVSVVPGTPAAQSGLEAGDQIVEVDGRSVTSAYDFESALASHMMSVPLTMRVVRGGRDLSLSMHIVQAAPPPSFAAPHSPPPPTGAKAGGKKTLLAVTGVVIALVLLAGAALMFGGFLKSESYKAGSQAGSTFREELTPSDFEAAIGLVSPSLTCQGILTAWQLEHGSVPGDDPKQWLEGCLDAVS